MAPPAGYQLVWSDEFDGTTLNSNKWMIISHAPNTTVGDGNAILKATQDPNNPQNGFGAGIRSRQTWTYGYFEFKAKLTNKVGFSSALWMSGENEWPPELDMVEAGSYPTQYTIWQTIHCNCNKDSSCCGSDWSGSAGNKYKEHKAIVNFDKAAGFHKYACEWTPTFVQYYIDGQPTIRWTTGIPSVSMWLQAGICPRGYRDTCLPSRPWCCHPEQQVATDYPTTIYIDYVRVYKPEACINPISSIRIF